MESQKREYELYRRIVEHEDNLINHRVSWLLIAQSFLLGACISQGEYPGIVICFGIFSTVLAYISILAALQAVRKIKAEIENDNYLKEHKPPISSTGLICFLGDVGAYTLPVAFLIVWIVLAFRSPSP
ncbi:hypothetical protein [uncultured Desulfobacter sp.]|uniref:hypothetical protein n=1 Tax=uncultured Desulfobacter sp. TaxID=240139 RepID=UPI0029F5A0C2|nr:hypothetical protein [uncultured Desulfobacter sp.]